MLDNGLVAATIPGKHQIALFRWLVGTDEWTQIGVGLATGNSADEITVLDKITVGGVQKLVYVTGNRLYLQDPTSGTLTDLGIVGTTQALAVGDLDNDRKQDLAIAVITVESAK